MHALPASQTAHAGGNSLRNFGTPPSAKMTVSILPLASRTMADPTLYE